MSLTPDSLARLVEADTLLVISDFDGTLAGLTTDIYGVPVNADSLAALTRLAGMQDTHVAILSGRHLEGLRQVCHLQPPVVFAGSHGAESTEHGVAPTPEQAAALGHLDEILVFDHPLAHVEDKPFQRVVHTAQIAATDQAAADAILDQALLIDAPGTRVSRGKNIVEFSVSDVTKGTWIAAEIARVSPTVTLFIGDDTTDEDGFRTLRPGDVSVKVGEGDTAAAARVADIPAVASLLTRLADARSTRLGIPRDITARFEAVTAGFTAEVQRVTDWSAATPCEGWAASDIINHLVWGYTTKLRKAGIDLEVRGDTPAARWFSFIAAVRALLNDERAHSVRDEHRALTQATSGFLLPDIFMHTWDLARSQGHTVVLDPDYAARNLVGLQSMGEGLQQTGQFGPPVPSPVDADAGEQLMAYAGRAVR